MLLTLLLVSCWHCFVFQDSLSYYCCRKQEIERRLKFSFLFCFSCFFSYFPITWVCLSGKLMKWSSFVLKSNCLLVSLRLKKFIYFCPNFAAWAPVFLQNWPLQSPPLLEVVQLSHVSSYISIALSPPQQNSAEFWEMIFPFTTQANWFKGSFPIL